MHWKLILSQEEGRVELWEKAALLGYRSWQENRNTGQEILLALESLRQENEFSWRDIPDFQLELSLPPHSTARRIAETFQKTYTDFVGTA